MIAVLREVMKDIPQAYYPLSEASGSYADASPSNRPALTVNGAPSRRVLGPPGMGGPAAGFDGVDDYLSAVWSSTLIFGYGCMLYLPDRVTSATPFTVVMGFSNGNMGFGPFTGSLSNEVATAYIISANHFGAMTGTAKYLLPGWHHMFVGAMGNRWEVFWDGVSVSDTYVGSVTAGSGATATSVIVARYTGGGAFFKGRIAHAYYTSAELPARRIRAHAAEGLAWANRLPRSNALVA